MLRKVSNIIVKYFIKYNKIEASESDLYRYGLELIISNVSALLSVLIVGIITGYILETLTFICVFFFTRKYGGGYHAKTMLRCMALTIGVHLAFIALMPLGENIYINYMTWIQIVIIYFLFVPQNEDIQQQFIRYRSINFLFMFLGGLVCLINGMRGKITYIVTYSFYITALANLWEGGKTMIKLIKKIAIKNIDNCSPWEFFKPEKPNKKNK